MFIELNQKLVQFIISQQKNEYYTSLVHNIQFQKFSYAFYPIFFLFLSPVFMFLIFISSFKKSFNLSLKNDLKKDVLKVFVKISLHSRFSLSISSLRTSPFFPVKAALTSGFFIYLFIYFILKISQNGFSFNK